MRVRAEVPRRPRPPAGAAVAGKPAGRGRGAGTGKRDPTAGREAPEAEIGVGKGRWALGELVRERSEPRRVMGMGSGKWALGEAWGGRWEIGLGESLEGKWG